MSFRIANEKYDLLCFGPFPPSKIHFRYNPGNKILFDATAVAEKNEIIVKMVRAGKKIENNVLYRYLSLTENLDYIILNLGHTDFGEYLLTDITHPEWNLNERISIMSHPLSVSAVTISCDNFLLMGYRSAKVVSGSGKLQTIPGGYIHPPNSILKTTENEIEEELAVKPYEIAEISVIGFAEIHPSGKPEILLAIRLNIPASVIFNRRGMDEWEFSRFRVIPESQKSITKILRENDRTLAPASHAALVSFAIQTYGIQSIAGILPELNQVVTI